ncbi:molybdopterin-dependent oxidoreductase [Granulosicoccus antarcticus]|uniref:Oxidoreductase molybdopterin-binding domain-containing protein n=1 Tax=Granulosicoccus antarcticus IMCC3135 TaxID=1192854 RepID=A0A2Z2NS64_9GAMM|nr:molybdopterin-dependent oxidoreductase [Granulosicoccus antarcticus]ASJ71580.1 hypothetical protein IMCC3135_07370 [Granulosicoccus antarcticus IMCC3135]
MKLLRIINTFAGAFIFLTLSSLSSHAQDLETPPPGKVILTVSGAINASKEPGTAAQKDPSQQNTVSFDRTMLEASGLTKIITETPWTKGLVEFEGVLARNLFAKIDATGKSVQARALDDYIVDIPIEDFFEYDVILATRKNGEPITIRDNGPVWIIYPWTDVSDLRRPQYYSRSIWQLKSLTILP